jgi:hypothetical protein
LKVDLKKHLKEIGVHKNTRKDWVLFKILTG